MSKPTAEPLRDPGNLAMIWNEGVFQAQRAATLGEEIDRWDANIRDLRKALAELEAERAEKVREAKQADNKASDLRRVVEVACSVTGWQMPETPAEVPLDRTGPFQMVPPGGGRLPLYNELVGRHVGVQLTDGLSEIWGFLEATDADELHVLGDKDGVVHHIRRSVISRVLAATVEPADAATEVIDRVGKNPAAGQDGGAK